MTDTEWFASTDPHKMLAWLNSKTMMHHPTWDGPTDRALRLWAAAWWRMLKPHDERHEKVALNVEFGEIDWRTLTNRLDPAQLSGYGDDVVSHARTLQPVGAILLRCVCNPFHRPAPCENCDGTGKGIEGKYGREFECPDCHGTGHARPAWLTDSVVLTARTVRDSGRWCDLGILADQIEEAGGGEVACPECHNGEKCMKNYHGGWGSWKCEPCHGTCRVPNPVVQHLRTGTHCKGCWAMEFLLGEDRP